MQLYKRSLHERKDDAGNSKERDKTNIGPPFIHHSNYIYPSWSQQTQI